MANLLTLSVKSHKYLVVFASKSQLPYLAMLTITTIIHNNIMFFAFCCQAEKIFSDFQGIFHTQWCGTVPIPTSRLSLLNAP
jgi:hypothetical protein